ncbi:hypothetical protein L227DRAFT_400178 [Lentinus tigrinus ALCF2SS1-6]|uniref:Uncharacterized protein n=1 Tax=Lentinus tigrinus ALCF2SS1-6 TaxID=1328759 RepID=A0A5C2RPV7_9APHY|nr:hypothetical protein L227DRAFT_400178 [Lentinus tigrinus ALCF2SS1-6]
MGTLAIIYYFTYDLDLILHSFLRRTPESTADIVPTLAPSPCHRPTLKTAPSPPSCLHVVSARRDLALVPDPRSCCGA